MAFARVHAPAAHLLYKSELVYNSELVYEYLQADAVDRSLTATHAGAFCPV